MKRHNKNISIVLICIVVLSLLIQTVYAENSRVTFTSKNKNTCTLSIKKEVITDESYEIPDAYFNFALKLDGQAANQINYKLYNETGTEITNSGNSFKTTSTGDFTLKEGQTAVFEYLLAGTAYEVSEDRLNDSFDLVEPVGGVPITGILMPDVNEAVFVNRYTPEIEADMTTLEVANDIAFPKGFTIPTTPAFEYTLKIDNEPYNNEAYNIIDKLTGEDKGTGTTDSFGRFSLNGGEVARFLEVETGISYEVTEYIPPGWSVIGGKIKEGITKAPITHVDFANKNISFGISNDVIGDRADTNKEFEYIVANKIGELMPGVGYFKYNVEGEMIGGTVDSPLKTDANGKFLLKDGETAIFFGLDKGTVFNVFTVPVLDYIQNLPKSNEGYMNRVVSDSFETLPFINEYKLQSNALTVTKEVAAGDGDEMPIDNDEFTFILSKKDGNNYNILPGASYSVSMWNNTNKFQTDSEGKFTLKRNETAVFNDLIMNETYKVEEVELNSDYICEQTAKTGQLTDVLNFTITNEYNHIYPNLTIINKNTRGETLTNAGFDIYKDLSFENPVNESLLISDADGVITIPGIKYGEYYLKEMQSPNGYSLLANPIKLTINKNGNDTEALINDKTPDTLKVNGKEITLTIESHETFSLPLTGAGFDGLLSALAGILITLLAFLYFVKKRKRKSREIQYEK